MFTVPLIVVLAAATQQVLVNGITPNSRFPTVNAKLWDALNIKNKRKRNFRSFIL
jgi:hypothetical protein